MRKILVAVITLSSLFGIGTVTAMAEVPISSWNISVTVVDNSASASCTGDPIPATWAPLEPMITSPIDLMAAPPDLDFYVSLRFAEGTDPCAEASVDPTGTVTTSYTPNPSPNDLGMSMLDCVSSCLAGTLWLDGFDGRISASPIMPIAAGTFGGTLSVNWTP